MLKKEFQNIEYQINYFLCKVFIDINSKAQINENFSEKDTPKLLSIFTNEYEKISKFMGWSNKEYFDIAFMIKKSRNKYYHHNQSQSISENDEMLDLLCIIKFIKAFNELFKQNDSYINFVKYLDNLLFDMKKKCNDVEKPKEEHMESIIKKIDILFNNYDNIKELLEKQDSNIQNLINETSKKETEEIINEKTQNDIKKKKIIVKPKNKKDNFQETFSSDDIIFFTELNKIIDEDKMEKTIIDIDMTKKDFADEKENLIKQFAKDMSIRPPEVMSNKELLIWFYSIPYNWKKMSNFAKTRNILSSDARSMLYRMGECSEKGRDPTIKQLYYAKKIYEEFQSIVINKLGYKSTYFA